MLIVRSKWQYSSSSSKSSLLTCYLESLWNYNWKPRYLDLPTMMGWRVCRQNEKEEIGRPSCQIPPCRNLWSLPPQLGVASHHNVIIHSPVVISLSLVTSTSNSSSLSPMMMIIKRGDPPHANPWCLPHVRHQGWRLLRLQETKRHPPPQGPTQYYAFLSTTISTRLYPRCHKYTTQTLSDSVACGING